MRINCRHKQGKREHNPGELFETSLLFGSDHDSLKMLLEGFDDVSERNGLAAVDRGGRKRLKIISQSSRLFRSRDNMWFPMRTNCTSTLTVLVPATPTAEKKTIRQKIVHELKHYYHGFRLLALETKLSAKYMWRLLRGDTLSRRERQQLVRTVSDLFRLVPFSIFIIVPFMELALPIFIKLFPNMLPSTFQESSKEEEKIRKQVKVKVEMAKFLQDTIEEIALERRSKAMESKGSKALEFAQFIKKIRTEGGYVSNEELFKFSKLFEDELTLDNLSMSQLRSLCRLMGIQPLGTPEILRFQLHMKLRELKADDKQITVEGGVDALSTIDLQHACRARGMRAVGMSEERLRDQVIALMERHGDVKMSTGQIASMVGMLKKEDEVEAMTKKIESVDAPIMPQGPTSEVMEGDEEGAADSSKKLLDVPNVDPKVTVPLSNKNGRGYAFVCAELLLIMGFGDNANFDAVPAFGGRAEFGNFQGPTGGRRDQGGRGRGGGGNFSDRGENFNERKGYRRQNEDRESDDSRGSPPRRGHFGDSSYSGRGRPQGHQGYDGGSRGQKFGDSRSGYAGGRRDDEESRPGQDFNRYGNSTRGNREDGFGGGRYHGEGDRREFSGRDNKRADGGYESRGRLYSDDDPHTRDKRAGFDHDGERDHPPNRRSNEYRRNDRDDSRENWGHDDRRANDGRRNPPNESRGFGNSNKGFHNDADGYRRRDDVGSSRGNFGRDDWEDREAGGSFGGYRRDGPKDSGFAENRGRNQQRSFGDRNDDFDNRGYGDRGNERGRGFGDKKSGFNREDQDNDRRRPNNRFKEEEDGFGGRRQNSPDNRKGFGGRGGFGGSGRGGRFGGSDSNRGGQFDKREWSDSGRDEPRGGGSGFGYRNKSRSRYDDDNSRERDQQQNKREYVSGGTSGMFEFQVDIISFFLGERAPKDWTPETTSIDTLFARDVANAAHFEKDYDECVKIIGADENIQISSWENSGLHPDLIRTCIDKCHYRYVRPIQAAAIPLILSGRDVMGLAETGGGKTAAFVLPILHQILSMGREKLSSLKSGQILALVVAPTRELARQLYDSFRKHAYETEIKCCVAYGKIPRWKNLSEIHQGCHVLVGTGGRLMDFIQRSDVNVSKIQFLVLDEADMLLEDGRENHLNSILRDPNFPKASILQTFIVLLPVNRQTLLFSATFPADVERLAGKVLKEKYVIVRSSQRGKANVRVKQQFVQAEGVSGKNDKLFEILEAQRDKTTD
ncbi:hypothetical protein GCK32_005244, partial [Trichostrongylus colubriformis]